MVGLIAYDEDGNYDPSFNPLDNDYFELVTTYWDTKKNIEEGLNFLTLSKGPKLELCGKDKELDMFGAGAAYWRQNSVCIGGGDESSIYGDWSIEGGGRSYAINLAACNSTRRSTCKSREEIGTFLERSLLTTDVIRNIVTEDQFSNNEASSKSRFKGDSNEYFPIQIRFQQVGLQPVFVKNYTQPMRQLEVFKYTINDLIIDDDMFSNDERATRFMNVDFDRRIYIG